MPASDARFEWPEHRGLPHPLDDVRAARTSEGNVLGVIQIDTLDQRATVCERRFGSARQCRFASSICC